MSKVESQESKAERQIVENQLTPYFAYCNFEAIPSIQMILTEVAQ
jgi:hypothetical protein